jgi:hypothetical protein
MPDKLDVLATARCGCRVQRPIGTAIIQLAMCPLHEAAPQLLELLKWHADCRTGIPDLDGSKARAAIAAAGG